MDILEYLNPLRRWWWLLVVGTAVSVGATFVSLRNQIPVYQATSTLIIGRGISEPNPVYTDALVATQLANSYAALASRAPVRRAAMARLGLDWLPAYSVQLVPDTHLLEITVTDANPARGRAVADALASELVLQSPAGRDAEGQQRQGFVSRQLDDLEAAIEETQTEIAKAQTDLVGLLSAREIADAEARLAALRNKLRELQATYATLLNSSAQSAANSITVVETAELPTHPTGTNKRLTLMLAAAVGFLLSAATAYLLSYLDDTLKTPDDIQRSLGLTTLAGVPAVPGASSGQRPLMPSGDHSAASEAYRVLRTNLQFAAVNHKLRTLLVTSPAPSEGKSFTTANLGLALAQVGHSVVLVDADLHRPRLHQLFGAPNTAGLTSALLEEHPGTDGLINPTTEPRLRLLPSGPHPPNPTELLSSPRMQELLSSLAGNTDVILLDSPPVLIRADAAVLSSLVDGVLLVIEAGRTRRGAAQKAVESLRAVNAPLVGVIINRVPTRGTGAYYYYGYYNDYGYTQDGKGRRSGLLRWLGAGKSRKGRASRTGVTPDLKDSRG